jgi:CheY-like chemotaxis protein
MRILVADQNALLLAAITATFGPYCDLATATRRDLCLKQVEQHRFDVVVACDKLSDYTGLELLSEIGALSPDTLLIFAANPKRLNQLGKRLAVFGLFEVLGYPITPQKLLDVLKRARQSLRTPSKPKVRHVVLESEWDTGVRLGLVEKDLQAQAEAAGRAEHDDWAQGADAKATAADPGVEGDDFVFSGPPVVSPDSEPAAPPPRAETRARTFEATPVAPRITADAGEVIEYEVKPVVLALTHDSGTIACDDEFIFASSQSIPVAASAGAGGLVEVEPAGAAVAQETEPSIEDFCSNDPIFDVPEPPRWAEDGAANDTAYEARREASDASSNARGKQTSESPAGVAYGQSGGRGGDSKTPAAYSIEPASGARAGSAAAAYPTEPASGAQAARAAPAPNGSPSIALSRAPTDSGSRASDANGSASSNTTSSTPTKSSAAPTPSARAPAQRRTRMQSVPTAAQRAAFERALARRNAGSGAAAAAPASGKRHKGAKAEPTIQADSMDSLFASAPASERPSKSLIELAKIATHKRPLSASVPNLNKSARPKRAVYAVSSGLAAVLILGVLTFELLRSSRGAEHHHMAQGQATSTQLFSSRTLVLGNNEGSGVPQFGPPVQQGATSQDTSAPNVPVAQTFDPNAAPEDPPPPPAVEQPGPMEPPSSVHTGPPLGMMPQGDGSADADQTPPEWAPGPNAG